MLLWNSNGQYYMHNAHGDVTGLTDAQCNVTKTYTYDAFGIEQNIDPNDTNPFRYCEEYYDKLTKNTYLRARYYRPSAGRFLQEDPAKDGLNWYSYCNGNPIKYKDPSGMIIRVEGEEKDQNLILWHLQQISDHILVNNGGIIEIAEYIDGNQPKGSELIERLINSEFETLIKVDYSKTGISSNALPLDYKGAENGKGSNTVIVFKPYRDMDVEVGTYDFRDGEHMGKQPINSFIVLGHELIHADHNSRGTKRPNKQIEYTYIDENGNTYKPKAYAEELATVGIVSANGTPLTTDGDITENDLRWELGIPLRVEY